MKTYIFIRELINVSSNERGSLSLENVLFIGAIAGVATGVTAFYGEINTYLSSVTADTAPTGLGTSTLP